MDVPIGIRRAVMQHERLCPFPALQHLLIQFSIMPALLELRFLGGKLSAHLKRGLRHEQCLFVVHLHSSLTKKTP